MQPVAGIFQSRSQAEQAIQQLHSRGIKNDRIALLTPGMDERQMETVVPTEDSEQGGMGKAMGGVVGGAMGVAGGAHLGAAAASLLVPGVGPVLAGGILGAALLGAAGTAAGITVGDAAEDSLVAGLPHDELYVYEDAVNRGRAVVIAFPENDELESQAKSILATAGAESVDDARESWWLGLRDAEEADYTAAGKDFQTDEASYRRGFEAALNPAGTVESDSDGAFQLGYKRGKAYQKTIRERYRR